MTTRRPTAGTDAIGTAGQTDPVPRRPLGLGASVIGLLADSVVPLLAYYALRSAGASV